jgi:hypothetical protein
MRRLMKIKMFPTTMSRME